MAKIIEGNKMLVVVNYDYPVRAGKLSLTVNIQSLVPETMLIYWELFTCQQLSPEQVCLCVCTPQKPSLRSSLRRNMSTPIRSHFSFYTRCNYIMLRCSKPLQDTNAHQHVFKDHLLFDQFSWDQSPAIKMEISAASPLCLLWSAKQVLRSHMKSEFFNWQSSSGWRC